MSRPRTPPGRGVALTRRGVLLGARLGAPFAATSLLFGMVFGTQARQAGMGIAEAALMSAAVASGTAQMIAVGLWEHPLPVAALVLTTLAVNLRYVLLGAALSPWLAGLPRRARYGSVFLLFDENWAVSMSRFRRGERDAGVLVGSGAAILAGWLAGTLAGNGLAGRLPDPAAWGLDFLVTATFLAILATFWEGPRRSLLPWVVAGGVALLASRLLPGAWYVLLGGVAGGVAGGIRDAR